MADPAPDFQAMLHGLANAECEFIVVGGVCAVLHGAPISTFDLDLVHSRTSENLSRLECALREMEARYRQKPAIEPTAARLDTSGHHLLMTRHGPLDLLGSTVGNQGYEELLPSSRKLDLGPDLSFDLLDLPKLIEIKRSLGRDRDLAVLPILIRTLEEQRGNRKP